MGIPVSPQALDPQITAALTRGQRLLVALDGHSGAGKTTFAQKLAAQYDGNLFHMDDFFLRPEQKTAARLAEPGGNVDYERFLREVLEPVRAGRTVDYRRYDCHTQTVAPPVSVPPRKLNIIEGSYALHPVLWPYYDLRIFLSVTPEEQRARILRRNGPKQAERFFNEWIVLENTYFDAYSVQDRCDCILTL